MSDDDVSVKFGAQIDGLIAGIDEIKEQIEGISSPIASAMESLGGLGEAFAEAFAVEKIAEFTDHIAEMGEQIERTSAMTGISADHLQTLQFAMKMTGGDGANLGQTMMRMSRNIETAVATAGPARQAFSDLGVSLDDLKTKSPYEILQLMADGFTKIKDPIQAMADATTAGGRGIGELFVALQGGSASLDEFKAKLDESNSALNEAQIRGFAGTSHAITQLSEDVKGIGVQAFRLFKPEIDLVIMSLQNLAERIGSILSILADLGNLVQGAVAEGMLTLAAAIGTLYTLGKEYFNELYINGKLYLDDLGTAVRTLAEIINDWVHGDFSKAKQDLVNGFGEIADAGKKAAAEVAKAEADSAKTLASQGAYFEDLAKRIMSATVALTSFGKANKETEPPANRTGIGGPKNAKDPGESEEEQIEKNDLETETAIARIGLQQKKDILAQEVTDHAVSKQQEIDQEELFVLDRARIERDALDKYAALYDEDTVQYAEAQNKKKVLAAQTDADLAKLNLQAASAQQEELKATQAAYKGFFDTLDKDMDQMLSGVLQGTQTWQQAMVKLWSNLATSIIEDIAKIALKAAAFQGAQSIFGAQSGVATAIGGEVPAALGGTQGRSAGGNDPLNAAITALTAAVGLNTTGTLTASQIDALCSASTDANTLATNASSAQSIFAVGENTVATVANTVATNAAAIGKLLSFDVGTPSVPFDMMAMIHQGEMIIPAAQAAQIRSGAGLGGVAAVGGGGDSYNINFNVNAMDSQSVASLFKSNGAALAQTIAAQMRNNNPNLRPS